MHCDQKKLICCCKLATDISNDKGKPFSKRTLPFLLVLSLMLFHLLSAVNGAKATNVKVVISSMSQQLRQQQAAP